MPGTGLRRAAAHDGFDVASLLSDALSDTSGQWLCSSPVEHGYLLGADFNAALEYALAYGHVDVSDDLRAVAVWQPHPTDESAGEFPLLTRSRPDEPYHQLVALAVHPSRREDGLATALLRLHHNYLDTERLPGYVEATSKRVCEMYALHGYQYRPPVRVPNGPWLYPMVRAPMFRPQE